MDLKSTNSFSTNQVWANNKLIKNLTTSALVHDELFNVLRARISCLGIPFSFLCFELFHALLDLFG